MHMQLFKIIWTSTTQRVMLITVLGMVVSLFIDMIVAYKLGAGVIADSLIMALTVPLFMDTIIREGNKSTLVPILLKIKIESGESELYLFLSKFINSSVVLSVLIMAVIFVFSDSIISAIAPGLSLEYSKYSANYLSALSLVVLFSSVITIVNTLNNIRHKYLLLASRNIVVPIIVIIFIGLGWDSSEVSGYVVIGYVSGFLLYLLLVVMFVYRGGFRYKFTFLNLDDYRLLASSSLVITFGFIINQAVRLFERSLATTVSAGALAAYYFSFRLYQAGQNVIASSVLLTILPKLSKAVTEKDLKTFKSILIGRLALVTFLSVIAAIFIFLYNVEIVKTIYFRGAFTLESLDMASSVLSWLGIVLIFQCAIVVLQGGLFALRGYYSILTTIIIYALIIVVSAPVLVQIYGIEGIAISIAVASFANVVIIMSFIALKLGKDEDERLN